MKRDPSYVQRLENLKRSERDRLLYGSWYARETASKYFQREWVKMVEFPETNAIKRVRCWDLASSVVSEVNKDPDYSCSVLMSRTKEGIYTIEDAYRFRALSGDVLNEIIKTSLADGIDEVQVVIPLETGAGRSWSQHIMRVLAENGIPCKFAQVSGHRGKVTRYLPFCSLAESGHVRVVKAEWNDWYFNEAEMFDGGRKGHDDSVDCTSDCVNYLAKTATIPTFVLPTMTRDNPIPQ